MVRSGADVLQAGSLVAASEEPVAQLQHPGTHPQVIAQTAGEIVIRASHSQTSEFDVHLQGMAVQDFADPARHFASRDSL